MSAKRKFTIKSDLARLDAMSDKDIDYSDIPEIDEQFLARAKMALWPPQKERITLRLDADILAWLKSQGQGYQSRINRLLRVVMEQTKARKG
jgi:uncharacterized protein (DUF4415 family)